MADNFRAMLVSKDGDQQIVVITELAETDLMDGDVTVALEHSTVNYKDGLAIRQNTHHPQIPPHPWHRFVRQGVALRGSSLPAWRSRRGERFWSRRDASRRLRGAGLSQG